MPEDGAWQHGGLPRRNHRQRDFPARFRRGTSRNRALSPEAPFHAGRFEPAARAPSVRCERMRLRVALCEYFMTTFNDFGCSEERCVGKEGVSQCRYWWWPYHKNKK